MNTFSSAKQPYESHYYHFDTRVKVEITEVQIRKGDWLIPLDNIHRRFLIEVLEPEGPDSYFNWNFFDAILQQKEWYSAYVFEDEAAEILNSNAEFKGRI